ncbi:MAG: DUF6446 family protein, partial [Pseudomonadota bacterium]
SRPPTPARRDRARRLDDGALSPMRAKPVILVFAAFLAVFAGALWWFQTRAYYEVLEGDGHVIVQGQQLPVQAFEGIDAPTSPLKLRACFRLADGAAPDALAIFPAAEDATPLVAPGWFDCFDARALSAALADGPARAVLAEANAPYGFDRIVALSPEGRGWMWRQINRCGEAVFAGDPLPEGCPPRPGD